MRRNLSCYRVFHCFLIIPFVLLSRCQCQLKVLGKAVTSLTAKQASKNTKLYLQNFSDLKWFCWNILLEVKWPVNTKYSLRQRLTSWQSTLGFSKLVERVKQLLRPSHSLFFVLSGQHTNENVHSLNTVEQVTMRSNLSCYRMLHGLLTPLCFVRYQCQL